MRRVLRDLLVAGDFAEIARLARARTRVLGDLVPLTYDRDPQVAWRAVEAMGAAGAACAEHDPGPVREHLRRLYWLLSEESGGICWRAPEAIAEIAARRPDLFGDYIPIVVHMILEMADEDLEHFRPGLLWAIGRLGDTAAGEMEAVLPAVAAALDHPDPQVRGMAVRALQRTGHADLLAGRPALLADDGPVDLYEAGVLHRTTVGTLAQRGARRAATS
ncbi:MAG TPA: hypothetical protein VJ957_05480 [Longimicrobiales bacterium]|nr:hypothetical protein [Longimicrobiales bacterium]